MQKQSVLLINKFYSPDVGGIETAVFQYAQMYKDLGYDVTVLCCHRKPKLRTTLECHNKIKVIRSSSLGTYFSMPISVSFFWYFFKLSRRCQIVHLNMPFPLGSFAFHLIGWFIKGKVIASYHCDLFRHKWTKGASYFLDRLLLKRVSDIITNSPSLRDTSEVLSFVRRDINIIPYFIDAGMVSQFLAKPKTLVLPRHFYSEGYFLFFGRLVDYKGIRFLLEAMRDLFDKGEQINFVIAGKGPYASDILKISGCYPYNVLYIDEFISEVDKFHLLKEAKAFLFPSQNISESFGIVQVEAMSVACPIINCNIGTGVNWVAPSDICAITVEPTNRDAFVNAIMTLHQDHALRDKLGHSCYLRFLEHFSKEKVLSYFVLAL